MGLKNAVALVLGATVMAGGVSFGAAGKPTLTSGQPARPARVMPSKGSAKTPEAIEPLFRGDMEADLGLGCSDATGTTGGPNDWAEKVTAVTPPPFFIVATTYNVFSFNSGPTWNLCAWANGATPGAVIGCFPLGPGSGTTGNHTIEVPNMEPIPTATFFFGLSQGTDTNGVRIGMDNDSSTPDTTFIRAPACGLPDFGTVESIGFPGFWVHRVIIEVYVPVELMDVDVS